MRHRAILLALSLGATLLAGPPPAHAAAGCPDPADHIYPGWLFPHGNPPNGRDGDPFAMSPGNTTLGLTHDAFACLGVSVTVERPDGSGSHQALLDQYIDGAGVGPTQYAYDTFDYATGTGPWRITKATYGGVTVDLTTPAEFRMTRGSSGTHVRGRSRRAAERATGVRHGQVLDLPGGAGAVAGPHGVDPQAGHAHVPVPARADHRDHHDRLGRAVRGDAADSHEPGRGGRRAGHDHPRLAGLRSGPGDGVPAHDA